MELTEFLGGRIKIYQGREGYRFSVDAVLLAHFINVEPDERIVDFGTGSGIIPVILAHELGYENVTGIEIQDTLAEYAAKNVEINNLKDRVEIIHGDLTKADTLLGGRKFDAVISNPPYKKPGTGKINPNGEKAIARHEIKVSLDDLLDSAKFLSTKIASLFIIYHPHRLDELIHKLYKRTYHVTRLRMIHPKASEPASLFMVKAELGSTKELIIEDPVYIYEGNGEYTPLLKKYLSMD